MSCLIECMIDWMDPGPRTGPVGTVSGQLTNRHEDSSFCPSPSPESTTELQNGRLIWGNHKPNWSYEQLGQLFRLAVQPSVPVVVVVATVTVVALTIGPLGSFIASSSIAKGSINMAGWLPQSACLPEPNRSGLLNAGNKCSIYDQIRDPNTPIKQVACS